jgi:hypothetical protein
MGMPRRMRGQRNRQAQGPPGHKYRGRKGCQLRWKCIQIRKDRLDLEFLGSSLSSDASIDFVFGFLTDKGWKYVYLRGVVAKGSSSYILRIVRGFFFVQSTDLHTAEMEYIAPRLGILRI